MGLAWLGLGLLAAQNTAASYVADRSHSVEGFDRIEALDRAIAWNGDDARLRSLRLQEKMLAARRDGRPLAADQVDPDLDALARLAPHETHGLLVRAEAAHRLGQPARAIGLLQRLHELDPRDPEATLLEATIHTEQGRAAASVAALYRDPHPRLRVVMAQAFADLEDTAVTLGRPEVEAFAYRSEAAFLQAVDALRSAAVSEQANLATVDLLELFLDAGIDDVRPLLLRAIWATALDQPEAAAALGREAARRQLQLAARHRRILGDLVGPLRDMPEWQPILQPVEPLNAK